MNEMEFISVWVAAISLFFHRWGKIRMLLPYQPVFKEEDHVMAPPTPPQVQQQRSISSTGCKIPFNSAALRRHQYMVSLHRQFIPIFKKK